MKKGEIDLGEDYVARMRRGRRNKRMFLVVFSVVGVLALLGMAVFWR